MEAIILASGTGKRLGELGKKTPKCLLDLNKKIKIIDKILIELREVKKIYIVVGYKKELIIDHLAKHKKKIRFINNKEYIKKGNFYSALICRNKIFNNFILLDADLILPKNALKNLIKDKRQNLVMTNPKNHFNADDIILNLNNKKIIKNIFIKKIPKNSLNKFAAAGVIKISKETKKQFFKELVKISKSKRNNSYYEDAYKSLFQNVPFEIMPLQKERLEIDTIKDYKNVLKTINKKNSYV